MHYKLFSNHDIVTNNHDNETEIVSFDSFHLHTYYNNMTFIDLVPIFVVLYNCLLVFNCTVMMFFYNAYILNIKIYCKSLSLGKFPVSLLKL